jgi:hypothetical protein
MAIRFSFRICPNPFFGREYGFLVFHDCQKMIYFKEIKTESVKDFKEGIMRLSQKIGLKAAPY